MCVHVCTFVCVCVHVCTIVCVCVQVCVLKINLLVLNIQAHYKYLPKKIEVRRY